MARKVLGAGSAQAVSPDQMKLKAATLTAGASADATAVITGANGGDETVYLNAKQGDMNQMILPGGAEYGVSLTGPVVATVTGTGAHLQIDY